ncbi:MAG: ABC transporter ATP-binding protein [Tissierellia bacterium]|nr:ABC transporter ATP-binding protein [Tissierellia bacterium]
MIRLFRFFKNVFSILGKYKKRVRVGFLPAFFEVGMSGVPYIMFFYILVVGLTRPFERKDFYIVLAAMVVSTILRALFTYVQNSIQGKQGLYALTEQRLALANHLSKINMGYFSEANIGDLTSIVSGDISFIEEVGISQMLTAVAVAIRIPLSVIFIFIFNYRVGMVYLILLGFGFFGIHLVAKSLDYRMQERQKNLGMLSGAVVNFVKGIQTIKAFNMTREKNSDIQSVIRTVREFAVKIVVDTFGLFLVYGVTVFAPTGVMIYALLKLMEAGMLSYPFGIGFIAISFVLFMPVVILGGHTEALSVASACVDRYKAIYHVQTMEDVDNNAKIEKMDIVFKNVSFSYEKKKVLNNINLHIKPKTFTALVGESGSGKTTITNLMARFWDIEDGAILIDGKDIKQYPMHELMDNISMVFQEVYLFEDTVFNNVAFGNPNASKEEVIEACKQARCHDFITALPEGYETFIGEGGSTLSGGEKQRISIARAMLKDAKLILLDEATAGIDPENEKFIQEAIEALVKNKTLVVIAHRLSTIRNADNIVVLKNGEIMEQGTQDELLKKDGYYKKQYEFYKKVKEA